MAAVEKLIDEAIEFVLPYITDSNDRHSFSLVRRRWKEHESSTRKHVTVPFCYVTTPSRLRRRYPDLKSLKVKGRPRAAWYGHIPVDWGGSVRPWIVEISQHFVCLKNIHFRRMIVEDYDLQVLATSRGPILESLKLDTCTGFTICGLHFISHRCRSLRVLFLDASKIDQLQLQGHNCEIYNHDEWLKELATNNEAFESLSLHLTNLVVSVEDLNELAKKCHNLVSVKINSSCQIDIYDLHDLFHKATALEEFFGGKYPNEYTDLPLPLPVTLCQLGLPTIRKDTLAKLIPYAVALKKLDLTYSSDLDTHDHCELIRICTNLEDLRTTTAIGDQGLWVLGQSSQRLRRLQIEQNPAEGYVVSHQGLIDLSRGCRELEYLFVYVFSITNESLGSIGTHLKNLRDFRLVVLPNVRDTISDEPFDNGVRDLLMGCGKLIKFAFILRGLGDLTDDGLEYIGQHSQNVRWMLLGSAGDSDEGLYKLSQGCPCLKKLEMVDCIFSESALKNALNNMETIRYLFILEYDELVRDGSLVRDDPRWNIEIIRPENPAPHILAYYSLDGQRADLTDSVVRY